MSDPLVSILLPFRNAAATLPECLQSIRTQSLADFELVAVDDHSSDGSAELVQGLFADDPRLRLVTNRGHGLVDALNHGLQIARSELVARMDADDRMRPQRLERQVAWMAQHPETVILGCGARLFPEQEIRNGYREYMRWQASLTDPARIATEIYVESPLVHPSVLFRATPIIGIGGYRDGLFPEDYELWLRAHRAGLRIDKLGESLLDWRESPQRTSRTDPRYTREAFDRLRAEFLAADPRLLARRGELAIWGAGRKTRRRCAHLLQRGFTPIAWIDIDPRKIGNRLQGVPVVSPEWLERGERRPFVLNYVANHGARDWITGQLEGIGYQAGRDFLMVG